MPINSVTWPNVKWDGCVQLNIEDQSIHICDVAEFVARLQELQQIAEQRFGRG